MTKFPRYIYQKRDTFYYSRRIPNDLLSKYIRDRVIICLRTSSLIVAERKSVSLSMKLQDYWDKLRMQDITSPASHLEVTESNAQDNRSPSLSEALEIYLALTLERLIFCEY